MFLFRDSIELVVKRLREGREELFPVRRQSSDTQGRCDQSPRSTYLALSRVPLMARDTNLIEEAMQTLNDSRHLL